MRLLLLLLFLLYRHLPSRIYRLWMKLFKVMMMIWKMLYMFNIYKVTFICILYGSRYRHYNVQNNNNIYICVNVLCVYKNLYTALYSVFIFKNEYGKYLLYLCSKKKVPYPLYYVFPLCKWYIFLIIIMYLNVYTYGCCIIHMQRGRILFSHMNCIFIKKKV